MFERYLLGELSEEERTELERRFFADDELFEELSAADLDLIDAYARKELSPGKHEAFERNLLSSATRRRKVAAARALETVIARQAGSSGARLPVAREGGESAWRAWSAGWRAAAAILLVLGGAWVAVESFRLQSERREFASVRTALERRVQQLEQQAAAQRTRFEKLAEEVERSRGQTGQTEPEVAGRRTAKPRTASFVLTAGLLRGLSDSNRLVIPPAVDSVLLQLGLEANEYGSYDAVLQRVGGAQTWRQGRLKLVSSKAGTFIKLKLAGDLLTPGDYILRLRGVNADGHLEPVGEYSLKVVRE
jgi:hypothetical protein